MRTLLLWLAIATSCLPEGKTLTTSSSNSVLLATTPRQASSRTVFVTATRAVTTYANVPSTSVVSFQKSNTLLSSRSVSSTTSVTTSSTDEPHVSFPANVQENDTTFSVPEKENVWLCFELRCWRLFACFGAFVLLVLITTILVCCWCRRRYNSTKNELRRERAAAFDIHLASRATSPIKPETPGTNSNIEAFFGRPASVSPKPQKPEVPSVKFGSQHVEQKATAATSVQELSLSRHRTTQAVANSGTKFMALRATSGQYGYLKLDIGQVVHVTMFTTPDCWVARDPETGTSGHVHPSWLAPYNPPKPSQEKKAAKPKSKENKTPNKSFPRYVNRPDAQKGSKYRAQFAFTATGQHQMDLKKGDILELLEAETTGWLWCKNVNDGKMGYVPGNYLCLVDTIFDPAEEEAAVREVLEANQRTDAEDLLGIEQMVLYDYSAQSAAELSLQAGETVTVIRTLPSGWACCVSRGKEGYFPSAYLQQVYEPLNEAQSGSSIPRRPSVKSSQRRQVANRDKLLMRRQSRPVYRSLGRSTYVQLRPDQKPGSTAPRPPLPGRQPTPL